MPRNNDVASWMALNPADQTEAGGWFGPLDGINQWLDRTGSMFQCNVPEQIKVCDTAPVHAAGSYGTVRKPPFSWQPEPKEAAPRRGMDSFASPGGPPPYTKPSPTGLSANHEMKILMMGRDGHDVNQAASEKSAVWEVLQKDPADALYGSALQNPVQSPHREMDHGVQWENKLLYSSQQSRGSKYTGAYTTPPPRGLSLKLPEAQAFESFTVSRAEHAKLPQGQFTPRYHRLDQPDDTQDSNPRLSIPEHEYVSPLPTREYDSPKASRASYSSQKDNPPSREPKVLPTKTNVLPTKIAGMNLDGSFKIEVDLVELAATPRESPQHLKIV